MLRFPRRYLIYRVSGLPVFWMLGVVVGQAGEVVVVAAAPREHVLLLLLVPRVVPRDVLVVHRVPVSGDEVSHAENGVVGAGRENPSMM